MPTNLSDLVPNPGSNTSKKRVGRGTGSGHGKTSGRGTKGQKARTGGNIRPGFEGGQLPIQKRLPYKRGFTNIFKAPWEIVNVGQIEEYGLSGEITPAALAERGAIRGAEYPVKILGDGEITAKVSISAHAVSTSAKEKIEAAGGTVTLIERTDRWVTARPRSRQLPLNAELKRQRFGKVGGITKRDQVEQG
jgi:large subunit ribosomal protein L15